MESAQETVEVPEDDELLGEPMEFTDHLEELRGRLIRSSLYVLGAGIPIAWIFRAQIIYLLLRPARMVLEAEDQFLLASFQEPLFLLMKIALIAGLLVASPAWLTELFLFVRPALTRREKRYAYPIAIISPLLFIIGALFAYMVIPLTLQMLYTFKGAFPNAAFFPRINEFLGLILTIMTAFGIIFQMPLIIALLAKLGVVSSHFLVSRKRHAIVVMAVLSAILTPTMDIINMCIAMVPILGLYEISIWVARWFEPKTVERRSRMTFGRKK